MEELKMIFELIQQRKIAAAKELLNEQNMIDLAEYINDNPLKDETVLLVFRLLPKDDATEVFSYLDPDAQQNIIELATDKEIGFIIDSLFLDDAVDVIEEMPATVVKRILQSVKPEKRKLINQFLKYPEDSAGSLMTVELVDLKKEFTVRQSLDRIRKIGVDKETINTCYVTDNNRTLDGIVSIRKLILNREDEKIEELMETEIVVANTLDDQNVVADLFKKYDLLSLPVVDIEGRLVGIITVDDIMDIIEAETTEDIHKMAAISPSDKPYLKTSIFDIWKARIPWLLILMISATFTGIIISSFESALRTQVILTAFIPMLMDSAGNSGGQSSVTIIRSMSLGEIEFSDLPVIMWKEFRVSILCGVTLAATNFIKMMVIDNTGVMVAAVVCITLFITIVCAKIVGCILPMVSSKMGFDPAVMSSPFITTIVDALSLMIYFSIATVLLGI